MNRDTRKFFLRICAKAASKLDAAHQLRMIALEFTERAQQLEREAAQVEERHERCRA